MSDLDYTRRAVPLSKRTGFLPLFFVMMGFTFVSSSMSVGAALANGQTLKDFALSLLLGCSILSLYTGSLAFISSATGFTLDLLSQRCFGTVGSKLPSFLIAITQLGWFGVCLAMFALPVAELTGLPREAIILVAGLAMMASGYIGMKGLALVSYIAVPLIFLLGAYSVLLATQEGNNALALFDLSTGKIPLLTGVGMVVGGFVSGGTTTPNFIRYAQSKKSAVFSTVFAFFVGNCLMFFFGAVGGALTGKNDIFYVMIAQGLAIPAIIVLGANIWTTNDNTLYSVALGFSNVTGKEKKPLIIICGLIGTVLSVWLYEHFISFLTILSATLPPIGAILVYDYCRHKHRYLPDAPAVRKIHWGALWGLVLGALAGNALPFGISSINAMAVSILVYAVTDTRFFSAKFSSR